jgi:hypothetical protein
MGAVAVFGDFSGSGAPCAALEHEGKYDNPNNAAIAHKYPLHKLRSKPKKDKKNVKQRLFKGGLVQELVDAGKGLLQMAGIGLRETAPGETAPTTESSPQKYDYNSFRKANGGKKWTILETVHTNGY